MLILLAAASLRAVTYIVPSDRDLVRRSDAIVVATAVESHAEETAAGGIATVTSFLLDAQLKGALVNQLRVTEPGGMLDDGRVMFIPGAPQFVPGRQYLLFLHRMPDGALTVHALGLGKFDFTRDLSGRQFLARGSSEAALGWNPDGSIYIEHTRSALAFLDYVRTVAQSPNAPAAENYYVTLSESIEAQELVLRPTPLASRGDYLWDSHLRWNNNATASIGYCCGPTFQPAPFDGPSGATSATAAWNGTGAIHYTIAGATGGGTTCIGAPANQAPCGGLRGADGVNTILFNDPNNELAQFGAGAVALGGVTLATGSYSLGGESFIATQQIDIVVGKNSQFPSGITQGIFNAVMTHELGHTLGFRHADGTGDPNSPQDGNHCAAPLPCSTGYQAIMESIVGRTSLGTWDLNAASTVYGSGPATCNAVTSVSISASSTSITAGNSTTLTANVTGGTSPFSYQWYQGSAGNTSTPVGSNAQSITVSPSSTQSYWVRVTPTCNSTPASTDSTAIQITVTCQNPAITVQPQSQSIIATTPVVLSVSATGSNRTYQWFQGNPPSGTALGGQTGATLQVQPSTTTTYYVVVSACGTSVTSNAATITVAPCTNVAIITQPQSTSILAGGTATLSVQATGSNLQYQWYIGNSGDTSSPAPNGNLSFINVTPTQQTSYWVKVTGACGSPVNSNTVTVSIGVACSTTLSSVTSSNNAPLPGESYTLTANASTTSGSLSYQWYRGTPGDTSQPIGNTQSITQSQTATSVTYWVLVTSSCGGVAPSGQITVNLNTGQCGTNTNQLCINNARYRVTLTARDPNGKTGQGQALYQSNVFGYFSLPDFSTPSDPQVFVKVLGPLAGPNGNVPWVFYSGLTNLDYTLTVVDTTTGQTFKSYHVAPPTNPFKSIGDFDVFSQTSSSCANVAVTTGQTSAGGACPGNGALCLLNRFNVTMQAKDNPTRSNNQGPGSPVPVNSVFGFFTTPTLSGDPSDIQAFVKMIDATSFTGKFWVFLGGLTDFDFTFTVTDTQTGRQKIYNKPASSTCGWNDTEAF